MAYLALHQLWLYAQHRKGHAQLWIAAWCATAATLLCGRHLQHTAATPGAGLAAVHVNVAATITLVALTVAVAHELGQYARRRKRLAAAAVVVAASCSLIPGAVIAGTCVLRGDALGGSYWIPQPGAVAPLLLLYVVAGCGYSGWRLARAMRRADPVAHVIILVPGGFMLVAAVNDLLLARGTISTVLLADFGVAGLAVGFTLLLARWSSRVLHGEELRGTQRSQFIERIIAAQEAERRRLARDLHDTTGQSVTSLLVRLRALEVDERAAGIQEPITELRQLAKATLEDLRRVARGLHPSVLEDLGFEEAVRHYCTEFTQSHQVNTDIHMHGLQTCGQLPPSVASVLYRIVQEGLTNVAKHAFATTASVLVDRTATGVRLIVEDDGQGYTADPDSGMPTQGRALGLVSIRERAALCGGSAIFESSPGSGTTVYVTVPLGDHDAADTASS